MIETVVICAIAIAIYMSCFFIIAQLQKNSTVVDLAWSTGFILVALLSLFFTNLFLARQILATALVIVWGTRLALHLYPRIASGKEDVRYKNFRKQWGKHFALRSFFQIFMLQGALLMMIAYVIIVINTSTQPGLTLLDYVGLVVWIVGFLFESVGDYQLKQFMANPANKGIVMDQGLGFTRHPNYFGEATMWWGIFLMALSVDYGWTGIISPLTITILLVYVSGIPMTEQLFDNNLAYQEYKKRTSAFFPWFPSDVH